MKKLLSVLVVCGLILVGCESTNEEQPHKNEVEIETRVKDIEKILDEHYEFSYLTSNVLMVGISTFPLFIFTFDENDEIVDIYYGNSLKEIDNSLIYYPHNNSSVDNNALEYAIEDLKEIDLTFEEFIEYVKEYHVNF